jgi:curved DNA-binding protein CbpA
MARKEYYKILKINKDATLTEIKRAYRDLARQNHPDKGGDIEKMKDLNEAYEILRDDKKKDEYDRNGEVSVEK